MNNNVYNNKPRTSRSDHFRAFDQFPFPLHLSLNIIILQFYLIRIGT